MKVPEWKSVCRDPALAFPTTKQVRHLNRGHMIAPLAKFIDWYALQVAAMLPSIRKCARGDSKLTERCDHECCFCFHDCAFAVVVRMSRRSRLRALGKPSVLDGLHGFDDSLSSVGLSGLRYLCSLGGIAIGSAFIVLSLAPPHRQSRSDTIDPVSRRTTQTTISSVPRR
jgi:hypothetical protein